ncbi:MAG: DUF1223 domain-containing protein [Pseudomonadota bacterium]
MLKSKIKSIIAALVFAGGLSSAQAADIVYPKGVVELFTSQGCYSCPPADNVIGEFAKSNEILGLSWHVDYWDYLGWKDTFASRANTERQYRYARSLRERQVYTPQAVINGRSHEVGSRGSKLESIVNKYDISKKGMVIPIKATLEGGSLNIDIDRVEGVGEATLFMISFNKTETVKIARGENAGKTLDYHNVVHSSQALGMIKANGLRMQYPISELKRGGYDSTALILQSSDSEGNPSAILGAAVITGL